VSDPQRRRRCNEIHEGILVHELVKKLEVFHAMRLGNVQGGIDFGWLLSEETGAAGSQRSQHHSSIDFHRRVLWLAH
jgi:hypothetical protein